MVARTLNPEVLNQWLGKTEAMADTLDLRPANLLAATLGQAQNFKLGDKLPALWHWLYFLTARPPEELGRDGHPLLGDFLPPVDLPRRMWAGGRYTFLQPLRLGDQAVKTSRIENITLKSGRSGALCFVTVSNTISVAGQDCLREEHDIVYREDPKTDTPPAIVPEVVQTPDWHREMHADPVMLFRYSALTFNGHRIHYDRIYCRKVEGYPDLVVHGPLIGTLLLDLAVKALPERALKHYRFRALSPVFDSMTFSLNGNLTGNEATLWAEQPGGTPAIKATAIFG